MPEAHERRTLPQRRLRDARELRALAHPLRVRLLDELLIAGPLTATELGERVQESPANCSWHLRQLAKYGYVEESGGGSGRRRPWRAVLESHVWGQRDVSAEVSAAGDAVSELDLEHQIEERQQYRSRQRTEPNVWHDAAFFSQSLAWLTAAELRDLHDRIVQMLLEHADRFTDPGTRPVDARAIRFVAWGFPARPWTPSEK